MVLHRFYHRTAKTAVPSLPGLSYISAFPAMKRNFSYRVVKCPLPFQWQRRDWRSELKLDEHDGQDGSLLCATEPARMKTLRHSQQLQWPPSKRHACVHTLCQSSQLANCLPRHFCVSLGDKITHRWQGERSEFPVPHALHETGANLRAHRVERCRRI